MPNIYDENITRFTDWGGDESTNNLPVSGRAVQKFIKDSLQDRIGYVYEDRQNNRCIGFASEEDYYDYIEDPTNSDLIVTSWYSYFPPTPVTLDYPAYYGNSDLKLGTTDGVAITNLQSTVSTSASNKPINKKYYYIAIYENYRLSKVLTENNENITDLFENIGLVTLNGVQYKLYEFTLSSGRPLDANVNITFSK